MLNVIVNGARVSYDSLEEAKDSAQESGRGLAFWRETLTACAQNEGAWNDLLNDLWQSGAEDEAERLDRTFPKDAPRHWLLVALTLDGGDPWRAFLAAWEARGDGWILPVVSAPAFMPWLKQVQPERHGLLVRAFGADSAKWPNDLLPQTLKAEGTAAEVSEWQAVVEERKGPKPGEEMTITLPGGVPMTFCWCPATTSEAWKKISGGNDFFWMGSENVESGRCKNEVQHKVRLTKGFWLSQTPVTQKQYECMMGKNPVKVDRGDDIPVTNVSWYDSNSFCQRLQEVCQMPSECCLPTEANWEFACRAGQSQIINVDVCGWYRGNSGGRKHPVRSRRGNAWNFYDLLGGVWEWCSDGYGDYDMQEVVSDPKGSSACLKRVCRGGCYSSAGDLCRSARRGFSAPEVSFSKFIGFRVKIRG